MKSPKERFWAPAILTLASLSAGLFLGCDPGSIPDGVRTTNNSADGTGSFDRIAPNGALVSARSPETRSMALPARTRQSILVASFNIQAFGESKMGNAWVVERIVHILQQFDIVAIQEVRAKDQTLLPRLIAMVNANGARYDYILGPRLGRTDSKEQYAFIYDTSTVVSSPEASYTTRDEADLLHREPLIARFVTRVPPNVRPFSFSLVNLHTDPDEVTQEMRVMHTVVKSIREYEYASAMEDDVILMGDLNAAPRQFGPLAQMPGIFYTVSDSQTTNTLRKSTYDNIIFDRGLTNEYTGRSGVLDMCEMFNINTNEALKISDHFPIWAEFVTAEQMPTANPAMIGQNGVGIQR
jgi:deoxyribonuclease-1-like protein